MQFADGARVSSINDQGFGRVTRVVLNPETSEVTHIVAHRGLLFAEERVIPLELVWDTAPDLVLLRGDPADLQDLPPFEEVQYVAVEAPYHTEGVVPMAVGGYLTAPSSVGAATERYQKTIRRNIAYHVLALRMNAQVVSEDDHSIGNLERVWVDVDTHCITHLLIAQGFLVKTRWRVPMLWCQFKTEDEVYLMMEAAALQALPEYVIS